MIVAAGCGYTASDSQPDLDVSWLKWPEIIAEKLDKPLYNFAKCGYGNDYILDKSLPFISRNYKEIDLVVVGWTDATRLHFYYRHHFNPIRWLDGKDGDDYSPVYNFLGDYPYSVAQALISKTDPEIIAEKYYEEIETLTDICEALNIKYIFSQMLPPIDHNYIPFKFPHRNLKTKGWLRHPIYDKPMSEVLLRYKEKYLVSDGDGLHPNKAGHEYIANMYLKKYNRLYG